MNPSILLFGATSILGFNLAKRFPLTILPFVPPGNKSPSVRHWPVLQLEDPGWIQGQFKACQTLTLIYCHAVCDVTKCEVDPEWAYEMNVAHLERGTKIIPDKIRLVYVSSDHVFGGDGRYTEASIPSPISVYGRTRITAEQLVLKRARSLVLRIGLPIGPSPDGRTGHLDWLASRSERGLPITIIEDEYRSVVRTDDLKNCEKRRDGLHQQLASFGDFRPGTISVTFSKCGKKRCICHQKGHPGHGPRYLWSTTRKGKSLAQHLRLGPELDQVRRQVEAGRRFQDWCQEVIETNEQICRLRPVPEIEDEKELETLKKKLRRKFLRKRKRKSTN